MKEFDWVELIADKEEYKKYGVVKGMIGNLDSHIDKNWLVIFDYRISISVDEDDLKVIPKEEL